MSASVLDYSPMCTIKLSGRLARICGREHSRHLDTGSTWEAFSALRNTVPGFKEEVERAARNGQRYAVFRNRKNVGDDEFELGGTREIRIVPVLTGSKRGGVMQTVLGAVLIAIAYFNPFGYLTGPMASAVMAGGISMFAGGVMQMLSPQAKGIKAREATENAPSYAFGGPVNTTAMGNPVGILAGRRRIGGAIISAGIYAEDIA